jgi:hypothetical protein
MAAFDPKLTLVIVARGCEDAASGQAIVLAFAKFAFRHRITAVREVLAFYEEAPPVLEPPSNPGI